MQARDIMTRQVITIGPEATVFELAELLTRQHISGVPVLDSKFLAAPTATPELEATEAVIPTIAVEEPTVAPEPTTTE